MSNSAWCDLKSKGPILKIHDMCSNSKCDSQKQITFTPKQFQLYRNGYKSKTKKIFKKTQKAWDKFR